jgi:DNA-directed RNA polymerase subunit RPC12/RpoP
MKWRGKALTGHWTCERCGDCPPLQISPLNDAGLRCPRCGNPLVYVPDFRPLDEEEGRLQFEELRKTLSCPK